MAETCMVPIPKMDVLMEDFTNIKKLIDIVASDSEQLRKMRNSWEVFFMGYDDDPRELPNIPEVVNWIEQSVEDGIPWFYFMRATQDSLGLVTFMTCCCSEQDPDHQGRYVFDKDRTLSFVKKNLDNLANFVEERGIPQKVGCAATDDVMAAIQRILTVLEEHGNSAEAMDKKQFNEAIERLLIMEKLYKINPNIRKYFSEGKLYYSYITGGILGSIDTINYDERYAKIVRAFEEKTSYLVYHVIESDNAISLLFVSNDCDHWETERPTSSGVLAQIVNMETYENKLGFICLDTIQGALYRRNNKIYSSMPYHDPDANSLSASDSEIVERLDILKNIGIMTDLDITGIFMHESEICYSILQSVFDTPVGVINRISSNPHYVQLLEALQKQMPLKFYFLMGSNGNKLAFLYVSEDESKWEYEKLELENKRPFAVVVDLDNMTVGTKQIEYKIVHGGPIFTD